MKRRIRLPNETERLLLALAEALKTSYPAHAAALERIAREGE